MTGAERTQADRLRLSLERALGPVVTRLLDDPAVVEIYSNPDGGVWTERHGSGRERVGEITAAEADQVVRLIAAHGGTEAHGRSPMLAATMPGGQRFQGMLPPVVKRAVFIIRRPAARVFTLDEYVAAGTTTPAAADALREAVAARRNVLVSGGTGSGKTTLLNALLAEPSFVNSRVVLIEDVAELRCEAPDRTHLFTRSMEPTVSMADLVRSTLRMRPDRIVVGEVRGGEALDLVKAWNTGHPGGIGTIHANTAADALQRLEDLVGEAVANVPRKAIASAIDVVVQVTKDADAPSGRRVTEVLTVNGVTESGEYSSKSIAL